MVVSKDVLGFDPTKLTRSPSSAPLVPFTMDKPVKQDQPPQALQTAQAKGTNLFSAVNSVPPSSNTPLAPKFEGEDGYRRAMETGNLGQKISAFYTALTT